VGKNKTRKSAKDLIIGDEGGKRGESTPGLQAKWASARQVVKIIATKKGREGKETDHPRVGTLSDPPHLRESHVLAGLPPNPKYFGGIGGGSEEVKCALVSKKNVQECHNHVGGNHRTPLGPEPQRRCLERAYFSQGRSAVCARVGSILSIFKT